MVKVAVVVFGSFFCPFLFVFLDDDDVTLFSLHFVTLSFYSRRSIDRKKKQTNKHTNNNNNNVVLGVEKHPARTREPNRRFGKKHRKNERDKKRSKEKER